MTDHLADSALFDMTADGLTWLAPSTRYSVTTTKHQSAVARSVSAL